MHRLASVSAQSEELMDACSNIFTFFINLGRTLADLHRGDVECHLNRLILKGSMVAGLPAWNFGIDLHETVYILVRLDADWRLRLAELLHRPGGGIGATGWKRKFGCVGSGPSHAGASYRR